MNLIIKIQNSNVNFIYKTILFFLISSMLMPYLPQGIRQPFLIYKMIVNMIMFFWAISSESKFFKKCFPVLIFSLSFIISAIFNNLSVSPFLISISDSLLYINMFLVLQKFASKNSYIDLIVLLKKYFLFYIIITDISIIILGTKEPNFLGTKFRVSYLHWFMYILLAVDTGKFSKRKNNYTICFFIWSIFILLRCDCLTGLIGMTLIFFLLYISNKSNLKTFLTPKNFIFYIFIALIIFFSLSELLNFHFIQEILRVFSNGDMTLTGRMKIYENLYYIFNENPWFGYGYQNVAVIEFVGYGNSQNGIFEILINYGLIGIIGFVILILSTTRKLKILPVESYPVSIMVIALIIASIVEVSFNSGYFVLCLAILYVFFKSAKSIRVESKSEIMK